MEHCIRILSDCISGLGGNPQLLDIGGVPYLLPFVNREKLYDLASLSKTLKADPAFLLGAGGGPWPHIGVNCEVIIRFSSLHFSKTYSKQV